MSFCRALERNRQASKTELEGTPWYAGSMTSTQAHDLLQNTPDGTFAIRDATTGPGFPRFIVSVKCSGAVHHVDIISFRDGTFGVAGDNTGDFDTIPVSCPP